MGLPREITHLNGEKYAKSNLQNTDSSTQIKSNDELQIVNLSSTSFSNHEMHLLQKGLSFSPTPLFNTFTWVKDINLFARRLALKKFFAVQNADTRQLIQRDNDTIGILDSLLWEQEVGTTDLQGPFSQLKPRSTFTPNFTQFSNIDTFVTLVTKDLKNLKAKSNKKFSNLTEQERTALENLLKNETIICKPSDKGGNIVVQDRTQYCDMVMRLLNDKQTYKILDKNPTPVFLDELKTILTQAKNDKLISQDEYNYMFNPNPTISTLYALPKIHKKTTPIPGRPIVSGCNNLTQGVSVYVDDILRPFVGTLPSFIQDTKDTVTRLDEIHLTPNTLLASLDVESLYTNIQHDLGIAAIDYYLNTRSIYLQPHNKLILDLLKFVLTKNYFLFNGKFYHQQRGTAMGTTCAPTYANLFLGWWESQIVFSDDLITYTSHILFWGRYIDDILIIFWDGTERHFHDFVSALNSNNIGMHFTSEINPTSINFLDLTISLVGDGSVQTRVYRKETSTNSFLHWDSAHPVPLKRGIPVGQYLRARRNCSNESSFVDECNKLYNKFIQRGYPKKTLHRAYARAKATPRKSLLSKKTIEKTTQKIRCIGTLDTNNSEVINILKRYWPILTSDNDLTDILTPYPSITYRRGGNLRDFLVHSHLDHEPSNNWLQSSILGSHPCGDCKFCSYMPTKKSFTNPYDKKIYTIREFINCRTMGVVYVAQCSCSLLYVGKTTQQLRRRICQHVSTINTGRDTPLARHVRFFHDGNSNDLKFWGIMRIKQGPRKGDLNKRLLQEEAKWIFRLNSLSPIGINEGFTFSAFI